MPDLGDTITAVIRVDPFDGTTNAIIAVTSPAGTVTHPATSSDDGGSTWNANIPTDAAGWWTWVWTVTGTGAQVESSRVWIDPLPAPNDVPDLAAVMKYLREFGDSWQPEDVAGALAAEAAAQRADCSIPAVYPANLGEALKRRVLRNLAMRQQPLAVLLGDAEAGSNTVLPGRDPEVRRLEAPYRPVVFG